MPISVRVGYRRPRRSPSSASTRPARAQPEPGTRWLGLEVCEQRQLDADHAEVEFVARMRPGSGRALRLHERSRFVREDGRWYYVAGDIR